MEPRWSQNLRVQGPPAPQPPSPPTWRNLVEVVCNPLCPGSSREEVVVEPRWSQNSLVQGPPAPQPPSPPTWRNLIEVVCNPLCPGSSRLCFRRCPMKHLQVRQVLHRELLKEQELSVSPHVLSLARASNRAPCISCPESSSIHLDSHMPLLTRARRVSQGHPCRYVFPRCLRTPEDTKGKEVSNSSSSQTRCERTESRRVLTFCTGTP